jgi:hypothetical protein
MIRTRIVEAYVNSIGQLEERELGWCTLAEVPVEKKRPGAGEPAPSPLVIKVNGENVFVIGHSWDVVAKTVDAAPGSHVFEGATAATALPDAILVLIIQKIPVAAKSGLVRADASAMKEVERRVPLGRAN